METVGRDISEKPERVVLQEFPVPDRMGMPLIEKWGDGIPVYSECDPRNPEWRETPCHEIDLSPYGYGEILVKDESDPASNPTRTIKDRAAWEIATLYRDFARALYLKLRAGLITSEEIRKMPVPRITLITAGNEGRAVAEVFKKYDLPAPKLVLDKTTPPDRLESLQKTRSDIYLTDLGTKSLCPEDIRAISNNEDGVDITSLQAIHPQSVFYDWAVHEAFNKLPREVYTPYGSGRLMENFLYWQQRTVRQSMTGNTDPRLKIRPAFVSAISILGAEPASADTRADKLYSKYKPFMLFKDSDISGLRAFCFTGNNTSKFKVREERIAEAHWLLKKYGIDAEPSAAAGLALYLQRYENGLVDDRKRVLVVSTGIGI